MGLYLSWWLLGDHKQRSSFAWPLIELIQIFLAEGTCSSPLVGLWFQLQLIVPNPCFINSDNLTQECLIFNVKSFSQQECNVQAFLLLFSNQAWHSSSRASATSFTLLSSVDVLGLPYLGSLSMLTQPPWKRLAKRETMLWSTVNSP